MVMSLQNGLARSDKMLLHKQKLMLTWTQEELIQALPIACCRC